MPTLESISQEPQVNVHCIVHPGFDHGEHPEFEANIHGYIDFIARETNDILFIITDGERFDLEQLKDFALLDIIEAISMYLGLEDGGMGDLIEVYDVDGRFSRAISNNGLSEEFYLWCKENINISNLSSIADKFRELKEDFFAKKYHDDMAKHDEMAASLKAEEEVARVNLDIESIARKALEEFGPVVPRKITYRSIRNSGRFFRIYQHAMQAFGPERMREIFIEDAEVAYRLPVQPVKAYQDIDGNMHPTGIQMPESDELDPQVFNISETYTYGNAATLKDDITTRLSVSRFEKLERQQAKNVLKDMGVEVNQDTRFLFLGEYRDRCVSNTMHVLNYRMSPLTGDKFHVAGDPFTLERPADHVGMSGF